MDKLPIALALLISSVAPAEFVERFEKGGVPATYIDLSPEAKPPREIGKLGHAWTIRSDDIDKIDIGDGGVRLSYERTHAYLSTDALRIPKEDYVLTLEAKDFDVWDMGENNPAGRWQGRLTLSTSQGPDITIGLGGETAISTFVAVNVPLKGPATSTRYYQRWIDCGQIKPNSIRVELHVGHVEGERPTGNEFHFVVIADGQTFTQMNNGLGGGAPRYASLEIEDYGMAATVTHLELRTTVGRSDQVDALLGITPSAHLDSNSDGILDAADLVRAE